jgi:hypothetical protein
MSVRLYFKLSVQPPADPTIYSHTYPNLTCLCKLTIHNVAWLCMHCGHIVQKQKSRRWALTLGTSHVPTSKDACFLQNFIASTDSSSQINREVDSGTSDASEGRPWTLAPICGWEVSKLERLKHDTKSTLFTNVAVWSLYHMVDSDSWTGSQRTLCKHYETRSGKGCPVNFSSVDGVLGTYFMKTMTTGLQVGKIRPLSHRADL